MSKLNINRDLIDSDFPGYKLSLDSLPLYDIEHELELDIPSLTDAQYSYQHAKAYGVHNHLFGDQWGSNCSASAVTDEGGQHPSPHLVYFIDDDLRIQSFLVHQEKRELPPGVVVYECDASAISSRANRVSMVVDFASARLAVVSDGCGQLLLLDTGVRRLQETWKLLLRCPISGGENSTPPSKLVDCIMIPNDLEPNNVDLARVECVFVCVEPKGDGDAGQGNFFTSLYWITLCQEEGVWKIARTRTLESSTPPDYVTLPVAPGCRNRLVVASEKPYTFVYDSEIEVKPEEEEGEGEKELSAEDKALEEELGAAYTWQQTSDDITAVFTLPASLSNKSFVAFKLSTDHIELALKGGDSLLCGELPENVDVESSNWTIEGQRLELTLEKKIPGMWPLLVCGDTRGKMCLSDKQANAIHTRLELMASESDDSEFKKPAYNTQELEECDLQRTDAASITCYHGDTHRVLSQTDLSANQWLFNTLPELPSHEEDPRVARRKAMCLRHDVDAMLLECGDAAPLWEHTRTFNALGYVSASKSGKKFTCCSPDFSYCAIFENKKHIYVYWRETAVLTSLRNRKTGKGVPVIAKQQLISLPLNKHGELEFIMGIHLENSRIYILTKNMLYMVQMAS